MPVERKTTGRKGGDNKEDNTDTTEVTDSGLKVYELLAFC
jgi:hypothetical protein